MKIGLIVRADRTGLGNQTRNLMRMLEPEKILVIDSAPFNGNKQDFSYFSGYNATYVQGFPDDRTALGFISGLDVVISCETFYNNNFINLAKIAKVKTILQPNWEFFDWNVQSYREQYPLPDMLFVPSAWHLEDFTKFDTSVMYLPPPIFIEDFRRVQTTEVKPPHSPRLLHVAGKVAHMDRNGTVDLMKSINNIKGDFELIVKIQNLNGANLHQYMKDERIEMQYNDVSNESDMYQGFDAMVLPRRYAGLCLPMLEALASGLPVIMTDVSPNDSVLPKEWLAKATRTDSFMARTEIDVYTVDQKDLGKRVEYMLKNLEKEKLKVHNIIQKYSAEHLKPIYLKAIQEVINE